MFSYSPVQDIYPSWEPKGRKLRQWMDDPTNAECNITKTSFSNSDISTNRYSSLIQPENLSDKEKSLVFITTGTQPIDTSSTNKEDSIYRKISVFAKPEGTGVEWYGYSGPGMLFISWFFRPQDEYGPIDEPYISEVGKAVFENDFPLDSLKQVFVTRIANDDTKDCLDDIAFHHRDSVKQVSQSWECPEPEFHALLGSRIGNSVSCLILGAFGQGIKRVSKITVISEPDEDQDLVFDIEDVPSAEVE